MFWLLGIPVALILGAAAGAAAKKRAAEAGTAAGQAAGAAGAAAGPGGTGAGPAPAGTTSQGTPTAGAQAATGQLSNDDMLRLVTAAITSKNPQTMRDAANQIRAQYPAQAQTLDAAAAATELAQQGQAPPAQQQQPQGPAQQPAAGGMTQQQASTLQGAALASLNPQTMRDAAVKLRAAGYPNEATVLETAAAAASIGQQQPPPAQQQPPPAQKPLPAGGMTQAEATTLQVNALASLNPQTMLDAAARLRAAGYPVGAQILETAAAAANTSQPAAPPPQAPTGQTTSGKAMAADITLKLKQLKPADKGTSREPRDQIKLFQIAEQLPRNDGSYGSETALAIAQRYAIVPAKPLYWGKKGGTYQTLVDDKNKYKLELGKLAAADPARADEWRAASAV
jgi:hypothetical protein